jgi:hypothetical protein
MDRPSRIAAYLSVAHPVLARVVPCPAFIHIRWKIGSRVVLC